MRRWDHPRGLYRPNRSSLSRWGAQSSILWCPACLAVLLPVCPGAWRRHRPLCSMLTGLATALLAAVHIREHPAWSSLRHPDNRNGVRWKSLVCSPDSRKCFRQRRRNWQGCCPISYRYRRVEWAPAPSNWVCRYICGVRVKAPASSWFRMRTDRRPAGLCDPGRMPVVRIPTAPPVLIGPETAWPDAATDLPVARDQRRNRALQPHRREPFGRPIRAGQKAVCSQAIQR